MDVGQNELIPLLMITTLVLALAFGIFQRVRAKKAKEDGETSAIMDNPEHTFRDPNPNGKVI